jgi:hypothetical protein
MRLTFGWAQPAIRMSAAASAIAKMVDLIVLLIWVPFKASTLF